jgi:hypothetical protein
MDHMFVSFFFRCELPFEPNCEPESQTMGEIELGPQVTEYVAIDGTAVRV